MLMFEAKPSDPVMRGMENSINPNELRMPTPPRCPFKRDRII